MPYLMVEFILDFLLPFIEFVLLTNTNEFVSKIINNIKFILPWFSVNNAYVLTTMLIAVNISHYTSIQENCI